MTGMNNYSAWFFLIMATLFNVADTVGRSMGGMPRFTVSDRTVKILSYSRVIFILTFFLIAYDVNPQWLFGVNADWFKILNMLLFAFTNGFASTQCAVKSPSKVHEDSKEQVGTLVGIFISVGILTGSLIALGMTGAVPTNNS
jgi:hypothetical protein